MNFLIQFDYYKILEVTKRGAKMFKFDHIAISVSDFKRSVEFYKKLGFDFYKDYFDPEGKLVIVLLKNKNSILELFNYKLYKNLPEHCTDSGLDLQTLGTKHFGLNVKDIKKASKFMVKNGILEEQPTIKKGRLGRDYFFIKDPDGIWVEIIEE